MAPTPARSQTASVEFAPPDHLIVRRAEDAFAQRIDVATLELRGPEQPLSIGVLRDLSVAAGTLAFRSGSLVTPSRLTWFDRAGKSVGTVGEIGDHYMPRLSPDGRKLAVETHGGEGGGDVFVYDLQTGTRTRLTFDPTHHNAGSTWSPDGSRLAFHSTRKGTSVFVKPVSGESPEAMVFDSDSANPIDWSNDGRFLLIDRIFPPSPGIYRVAVSGPPHPEPVLVDAKFRIATRAAVA